MSKNTSASATTFGFDFQINSALVLMVENIVKLKSLSLEGALEDIEIKLSNNKYILAQAKSIVRSCDDFKNVRQNLKKSLKTLSIGSEKAIDIEKLIFITNSPNPFNLENTMSLFYGHAHREFVSLPDNCKEIINNYILENNLNLDLNKFTIQILPFETDLDIERYKVVKMCVDTFVEQLNLNLQGFGQSLMTLWQSVLIRNSTKNNLKIILTKEDLVWPLIVKILDLNDFRHLPYLTDDGLIDEINHVYKDIVADYTQKFEFITMILSDFETFRMRKTGNEIRDNFILQKWNTYINRIYTIDKGPEIQEVLIKVILHKIIDGRYKIENIKEKLEL